MNSDQQSENEAPQLDIGDLNLHKKNQKVLKITKQVNDQVQNLTKKATLKSQFNQHLDSRNQARPLNLKLIRDNLQFNNFMTKKKNQSKRKQAFQIMRQMLQQKGYENISHVTDRQHKSVMVIRFVNKIDHQILQMQDQFCKEREKIIVKQCVAWVGLIAAVQVVYQNQMYRLQKIIDLSKSKNQTVPFRLNHPLSASRILITKGPFWKNNSKQNIGIKIIGDQIQTLRYRHNIRIDYVVIMGPILSQNNENVKNFTLENNYEQQFENIVQTLKIRLIKIIPQIQILIIPSTDDVISLYPIPQPTYEQQNYNNINVRYCSNPCSFTLQGSNQKNDCKINLINYDLISYIDSFRAGRSVKQPLIQNIQTYLKQPFIISNTLQDSPFDQTNLSSLFNRGQFGNIIIMSSQKHPPFVHKIKGRIFMNIGSLGVEERIDGKHYMQILSIYDGQGDLTQRVRIESVTM